VVATAKTQTPIVPSVLVVTQPRQHPYQLPAISRHKVLSETNQQLRLEGIKNQWKDKVFCLPSNTAADEVDRLYSAFQQALDELANYLRELGHYPRKAKEVGAIKVGKGSDGPTFSLVKGKPNPLSPTVIAAYDPDDDRFLNLSDWQLYPRNPVRERLVRHSPQMLRIIAEFNGNEYESPTSQAGHFVCPDDFAWGRYLELHDRAATASQALQDYLAKLGTYAQASADGRYKSSPASDLAAVVDGASEETEKPNARTCDRCQHGVIKPCAEGASVLCSLGRFAGSVMAGEIAAQTYAASCKDFEACFDVGDRVYPKTDSYFTALDGRKYSYGILQTITKDSCFVVFGEDEKGRSGAYLNLDEIQVCDRFVEGDRVEGWHKNRDGERIRLTGTVDCWGHELISIFPDDGQENYTIRQTWVNGTQKVATFIYKDTATLLEPANPLVEEDKSPQSGIPESVTTTEIVPADPNQRLAQLEADIQEGLDLVEQGKAKIWQAVAAIRSERLWELSGHESFEAYCKCRWNWEKSNAHEVALAGEVVSTLKQSGIPDSELPTSVSQTRELARVPATERPKVLKQAQEATNGKPTAKAIKQAAQSANQPVADLSEIAEIDPYEYSPITPMPVRFQMGDDWVEGQAIAINQASRVLITYGENQECKVPDERVEWIEDEYEKPIILTDEADGALDPDALALEQLIKTMGAGDVAMKVIDRCTEPELEELLELIEVLLTKEAA
jgi:hypothetical protein